MKRIQGSFITGYVTINVEGKNPEQFFQICTDELRIAVWDIKKQSSGKCSGKIRLQDLKKIRRIRKRTGYRISFAERKGYPFIWRKWMKRKHIVGAVIASFLLILALSNLIWSIQVTGISSAVEEKVVQVLQEEEVKRGNWMFSVASPSHIQQTIMENVPELLWVGVEKKGTTFLLEGIEKKRVDPIDEATPRHLIASKSGVITDMHVSIGEPVVRVNDAVKKGDRLVSGLIERAAETDEEETRVASTGEVIAEIWYNVHVSVPLTNRITRVTGKQTDQWTMQIGSLPIRIWGWKDPPYDERFIEETNQPLYFLQWKTPITFTKKNIHEQLVIEDSYTKEEAIVRAIEQVHTDILLQLGPEAIIKDEKVLHESAQSGKVNVQLLITVEEDIVDTEPLPQGD